MCGNKQLLSLMNFEVLEFWKVFGLHSGFGGSPIRKPYILSPWVQVSFPDLQRPLGQFGEACYLEPT